jgi:hypothetical protein
MKITAISGPKADSVTGGTGCKNVLQQNSSHPASTLMTIQRKPTTQASRHKFPKVFNFGMGRREHFGSDMRGSVPGPSQSGREETLLAPGEVSAPAGRKDEGRKEKPNE